MKIVYSKTGSTGNCSVIENSKGQRLIIDCGIKFETVNKSVGYDLYNASALIVSHAHQDHFAFIKLFAQLGINILLNTETLSNAPCGLPKSQCKTIDYSKQYTFEDFVVKPFPLKHTTLKLDKETGHKDDVPCDCTGYLIYDKCSKGKMLWITDTMFIENKFPPVEHICIECNYFEKESYAEEFQYLQSVTVEKRRLFSHLSFEECVKFINAQDLSKLKSIRLLHMSTSLSDIEKKSIAYKLKQEIKDLREEIEVYA